ncbi:phosphatase PAP2 family protein [Phenylobacterium sp. LjRoot225]|uniref:acid phosphatase n=1 Tax=Phenylobacterium sp. LjRoot225 TaxID=3342285 RepID=UPI003ECEAAE0
MKPSRGTGVFGLTVLIAAGVFVGAPHAQAPQPPQAQPRADAWVPVAGYLPEAERIDSLALAPPPPAAGSAALSRDEAAAKAAVALQGEPRWGLAARDAELKLPRAAQTFSCALGVKLDPEQAPRLFTLLARTIADLGLSTYAAKTHYMRPRPFTVDGAPSCTPDNEAGLRRDGSYPSGHSSIGWGWGLILAELAPDRADALLARGRAFGQSRVFCNVHWQSDVDEGRVVAAGVVAKLHGDPQFRADLEAARAEVAALRKGEAAPEGDCAAEAATLAAG